MKESSGCMCTAGKPRNLFKLFKVNFMQVHNKFFDLKPWVIIKVYFGCFYLSAGLANQLFSVCDKFLLSDNGKRKN